MFGPVLLGLTDVMRIFSALLGCAEESWMKLRRWENFKMKSQCPNNL